MEQPQDALTDKPPWSESPAWKNLKALGAVFRTLVVAGAIFMMWQANQTKTQTDSAFSVQQLQAKQVSLEADIKVLNGKMDSMVSKEMFKLSNDSLDRQLTDIKALIEVQNRQAYSHP